MPWVLKATPCCFLYSSENLSALLLICVIQKPSSGQYLFHTLQRRPDATSSRIESICREARSIQKSIQKFGFINGVDNVNWPPYRDSKS